MSVRKVIDRHNSQIMMQAADYKAGRYFFARHVGRYLLRRYNLRKPADKMYSRQRIRARSNIFNRHKLLSTTLVAYQY